MQRWNAKTRYALLAALDLAENYERDRPIKIQEIAARTGTPPKYLVHILLLLKRKALVNSTRGAKGGYWLLRPPEMISAAEVIGAVEKDGAHVDIDNREIPYGRAISRLWQELQHKRGELLGRVSLADLLRAVRTD